jgi:aminoglycoside phosphotransferase family enzyme/predicted kinase
VTLPQPLNALLDANAYPHPVGKIHLVETHISWILLTGELVYKIKRPVCLPFVDLRSPERRELLCHEEVRLNRRFAGEIYLGVCNITADAAGARIDGTGQVIEHAVKMLQFDRDAQLDRLLASHRIQPAELEAFGGDLAGVHATLPAAGAGTSWGRAESVRSVILRNLDECIQAADGLADVDSLRDLRGILEQQLAAACAWLTERHLSGRVRECHGDLHCSNIVRRQSRLTAFDCLEFDPALRWIDVADEIAFLLADMDAMQRPAHMQAFLGGYLAAGGDYHACRYLGLYAAHRSLVRAKVTALSSFAGSRGIFESHVRAAQASLSRKRPVLILMSGLSGSGKTWLAKRLAPAFGAVHIRSDIERKRLAGLTAHERSQSGLGQDLYAPEVNARLQQHLLAAAESTLSGGYTTIVDATFSRREDRARFAELARRHGASVCLARCHAPVEVLRSRIQQRERGGVDPSEANLAVLDWQQQHYEPLQPDEPFDVIDALSSSPNALARLKRDLLAVGS